MSETKTKKAQPFDDGEGGRELFVIAASCGGKPVRRGEYGVVVWETCDPALEDPLTVTLFLDEEYWPSSVVSHLGFYDDEDDRGAIVYAAGGCAYQTVPFQALRQPDARERKIWESLERLARERGHDGHDRSLFLCESGREPGSGLVN